MPKFQILTAASVMAIAFAAPAAAVTPIFATSYDTPNGDGQAHTGTYNYWDKNYTGSGSTTTDGAALTGGSGDLTDGVVASGLWNTVEIDPSGTGPYVGWIKENSLNPLVTFHFAGSPTINGIGIHLDNSGIGGVLSPSAIWIDGVNTAFTAPLLGTAGFVNFTGLTLTGNTHSIQFFQPSAATWTFVSEVQFFSGAVPEPASWAMMIAGFGIVGGAMRRRQTRRFTFA